MPLARAEARDRTAQVKRVLAGLLVANIGVVGAKFVIGLMTGSLAILGDAVHSTVDVTNNILGLAVVGVAAQAPDTEHPYGHTKFETVGALAIVVFLSVSGFEIVRGAIGRLASGPVHLAVGLVQIGILASTLVINIAVARYEAARGRTLGSELLMADAAHTKADVYITLGVIGGALAARAGFAWADSVVALVVAGAIAVVGWEIIGRAIPVLVDQHAVPAPEIQAAAEAVTGVRRAYAIRSRGAPTRRFAELTIAVDGAATVTQAHVIADDVETRLRERLQLHEIVVHVEPC
jgi:cation diffusion facilitator family transporter